MKRLWRIAKRELRIFSTRPLMLFTMILAPIICTVFFTSLMNKGLPTNLPAGVVDEDNTRITRIVVRILNSMEETNITHHYASFSEARSAMQRGEIYAFFYLPKGTTEEAMASRQPRISFFTNDVYFVPGTLLMKDMKVASELTGLALTRESLFLKGDTPHDALAKIRATTIETHPLHNSTLNYSVYLNNMLVPGIMILLIMLTTTYTIGLEWKGKSQRTLYAMADRSPTIALVGKLLPQTILFTLLFAFIDVYFYRWQHFPCNSGIASMMLLGFLTVVASQAFGVFLFGAFAGKMRLSMCLCSLWGILSFSLAGFTYPVSAMDRPLQLLSWAFPLRHYYLLYVNQALNGNPLWYEWPSVVALLCFLLLPCTVLHHYRAAFLKYRYQP